MCFDNAGNLIYTPAEIKAHEIDFLHFTPNGLYSLHHIQDD